MGFWDRVMSSAGQALRIFEPSTTYLGLPTPMGDMASLSDVLGRQVMGMSIRTLWRTQPHLRTVVSFRAENVAQLGLHAFTMAADGSRVRDRDGVQVIQGAVHEAPRQILARDRRYEGI